MSEAVLSQLTYLETFTFRDDGGVLVTTAVNADFTKTVIANGAVSAVVCTVTQIGTTGRYTPSLTPDAVGDWTVIVEWTADPTFAWSNYFKVETAAQADPAAYLAGASVTLVSPLSADGGTLRLIQGDSYAAAQSRSLSWTLTAQPDLTTATVTLTIVVKGVTITKTGLTKANPASGSPTITATLTKEETATLDAAIGVFDLSAAIGSDELTLVRGQVYVQADV